MYILGVDCAWTAKQPSGVALIKFDTGTKAEFIKLGRSYDEFCSDEIRWQCNVKGTEPDFNTLLSYCGLNGWDIQIIALDIPLSCKLITERRSCDSETSRYYGAKSAAVHSPNSERPGMIALSIYQQLINSGYRWNGNPKIGKAFIEVYPHASIIELLELNKRLPYKVQKKNKYWPDDTPEKRNSNIIINLNNLKNAISNHIDRIEDLMPAIDPNEKYSTQFLKGYEDALDALICSITGLYYLHGCIRGFGNSEEKIWVIQKNALII